VGGAVAAHFLIPESPVRSPGRLNLRGSALLSGWLLALLLGVSEGPLWGWGSVGVAGLFGAGVALFALWVLSESRAAQPLVDMRMMRLPAVWRTNLVSLLFGFVMYATFAELPQFFQTPPAAGYGFHASVTESGLILLPNTIGLFLVGLMIGRLTVRFGSKAVVLSGGLLSSASLLLLALAHDQVWQVLVATALLGIGIGLGFSAMSNLIVEAVPFEQTGVATGMNANIRTIGGAIGSQVSATLVTMGVAAGALPHESGYVHSFVVLAAAGLACALVAGLIPRRPREPVVWAVPPREPALTLADA
jgi:MFS family permease